MGHDPQAEDDGLVRSRRTLVHRRQADGQLPSEIQAAATRAIAAILDEAYADARQTLVEHMEMLRRIGVYLVQQERIDGDTFDALFDGKIEVPDARREWRPAARPREWAENRP